VQADLAAGEALRGRGDDGHHRHDRDRPRGRHLGGGAPPRALLHVDAALAGSAMILPECRALWDGIEEADSLVFNPHKWLGAAFDCSLYYVRDPQHLVRVMSTNPSYLRSAVDEKVKNLRDWGIPLGAGSGAQALVPDPGAGRVGPPGPAAPGPGERALAGRRGREDARVARARAGAAADALRPPRAARPRGRGLDRHTLAWADRLNRSGAAYLTGHLDGRGWCGSASAPCPRAADVEALWDAMRREATTSRP